ncbi:MAG: signal peptidase II [Clostridia bacterium]|nr:signal peptidase II [Clostridia bacterium]
MRKLKQGTKRAILWVCLIATAIGLDQLTKALAERFLKPVETVPIWENVLHLTFVTNKGAAFGMLQNQRWVFLIISTVAIVLLSYYLWVKRCAHPLLCVALSLIIGGGIGNMIDRTVLGYVIDFIDFRLIHFAVFNGADSFVTIGCVLAAVWLLFCYREKEKEKEPVSPADSGVHSKE